MIFNSGVTAALAEKWDLSRDWSRYVNAEIYINRKCPYSQNMIDKHGDNYDAKRFNSVEEFIAVEMSERDQIYGLDCLKEVSNKKRYSSA